MRESDEIPTAAFGSEIDGLSLTPPKLIVRGRDLNELIGKITFTAAIYRLVAGHDGDPKSIAVLDDYLRSSILSIRENCSAIEVIRSAVRGGAAPVQAVVAGLMVSPPAEAYGNARLVDAGIPAGAVEGLYYLAMIPLLLVWAIQAIEHKEFGSIAARLVAANSRRDSYLQTIIRLVVGDLVPTSDDQRLFEALLVAWHAGFGPLTPSVMAVRVVAGTGAPIRESIAAGLLAAGGRFHIGASSDVIRLLVRAKSATCDRVDMRQGVFDEIDRMLTEGERIPGFGHTVFKVDPRPIRLRELSWNLDNDQGGRLTLYDAVCEKMFIGLELHPNIDFITATILWSLNIRNPAYASGIACCARVSAMLAHALEKSAKAPFGARSTIVREQFSNLPYLWL